MNWFKFEKAVKILVSHFPDENMKKPALFHSIRVGVYLWNNWYSEDLQIAWLLHDSLEDTDLPEKIIQENFWENVLQIVKSNSKNNSLEKSQILEDIVKRCSDYWQDAIIVKIADVYDNFLFYQKQNNFDEITRCKNICTLIKKYKKDNFDDKIFDFLDIIINS